MITVKDVEYIKDYTLLCEFSDGTRKKVDLSPLFDTIFWSNGADIAPEYLYENGVPA